MKLIDDIIRAAKVSGGPDFTFLKKERLKEMYKELELKRALSISNCPEVLQITNQLEENNLQIQKLLTQNSMLWDARNNYIKEHNENFDKESKFPFSEYEEMLKREEMEKQRRYIKDLQVQRGMNKPSTYQDSFGVKF